VERVQRIEIGGATLEYQMQGAGEPIVIIHGGHRDECLPLARQPALSRYRIVTYHRRGWGGSSPAADPIPIAQQAADCHALLHELGITRASVVGQSSGAVIALKLTCDFPEIVHAAAFLEPALANVLDESKEPGASIEQACRMYEAERKTEALDCFLGAVCGDDYRERIFARNFPPGAFDQALADVDTLFRLELPAGSTWTFTPEDAARIVRPCVCVTGAETRPAFRRVHEVMTALMPNAEIAVVPRATHHMMGTNPAALAEILAAFFARHGWPRSQP
jgi:pimeloyl-ACP methyl ester carboxylesterase